MFLSENVNRSKKNHFTRGNVEQSPQDYKYRQLGNAGGFPEKKNLPLGSSKNMFVDSASRPGVPLGRGTYRGSAPIQRAAGGNFKHFERFRVRNSSFSMIWKATQNNHCDKLNNDPIRFL